MLGIPGALKDRVMSGGKNEFATALKKDPNFKKSSGTYEIGGKGGGADLKMMTIYLQLKN